MADSKISALSASTVPLGGTEVLPVVQGVTTKQVTVANLTAGRVVSGTSFSSTVAGFQAYSGANILVEMKYSGGAIINRFTGTTFYLSENGSSQIAVAPTSGDVTVNTGNIIPGTAAKGVNFTANTPAAGMTSQLLNWYEEGTWTPVVAIGITSPTYATQTGTYTRIGNTVFFKCYLSVNGGTLNGGQITLTGLPFTASGVGASANFGYVGGGAQTLLATSALPILNVSWSGSATTIYYYRTTGANFAGTDLSSSTARWDFSGQYTI
jgi:hypothetical protein